MKVIYESESILVNKIRKVIQEAKDKGAIIDRIELTSKEFDLFVIEFPDILGTWNYSRPLGTCGKFVFQGVHFVETTEVEATTSNFSFRGLGRCR